MTHSEIQTTICVKERKLDVHISGKILDKGAWEEKEVNLMMKLVDNYSEAVFLDIGSNLGIYVINKGLCIYYVVQIKGFRDHTPS